MNASLDQSSAVPTTRPPSYIPTTPPRGIPPGDPDVSALRDELDDAVAQADWARIEMLSLKIQSNEESGQPVMAPTPLPPTPTSADDDDDDDTTIRSLRTRLDEAVETGDWDTVESLSSGILATNTAQRLRAQQSPYSTPATGGSSLPPTPYTQSSMTTSSDSSVQTKVDAVGKLVHEERWKLVASLSSVYGLDNATGGGGGSVTSGITDDEGDHLLPGGAFNRQTQNPYLLGASKPPPSFDDASLSSTSTGNLVEKEIDRLVQEKDWKGLDDIAATEDKKDSESMASSVLSSVASNT